MPARGASKTNVESQPDQTKPAPTKWWHWFIVYPTLATSVVAAVPTYNNLVRSLVFGYTPGLVSEAELQNNLWIKNKDCLPSAKVVSIKTRQQFEIAASVCESGDVLLGGKRADSDTEKLKWVPSSDVVPTVASPPAPAHASLFGVISSATASERRSSLIAQAPSGQQVICQRWVGNGMLLQRVATQAGCFDQVINTFNGSVVSRQQAPCAPQC